MRRAAEEQFGVAVHEGLGGFDETVEGQSPIMAAGEIYIWYGEGESGSS